MSRRGSVLEGVDFKPMTFEGQEKGAEMLIQSRQLDQQKENQKLQREQKAKDDLAAKQKWIDQNFDPQKDLSGNPLADPTYNKGMAEINSNAYELAGQGLSIQQIKQMLGPKADKLHNYSITAKSINENLDKQLSVIPANSGYKKDELKKRALQRSMLNPDGTIKDSPDATQDYIGQVLSENPLDVTDASGLEGFVKDSMTNSKPQVIETKTYNSRGGYEKKKLKITAPYWMVLDTDAKGNNTRDLVPKYEIATDDGNPIIHEFAGKDGKTVKAPVRLVDDQLFNYVLKSNPSYSDNLRGQVSKAIQSGDYKDANGDPIQLNSPQAKNIAKALMYDDLKLLSKGGVEDVVETKPTQIHNVTNVNTGNAGVNINDVFKELEDLNTKGMKQYGKNTNIAPNELSPTAQNIMLEYVNKLTGGDKTQEDFYIRKEDNGNRYNIYEYPSGKIIAPMNFKDINLKAQPGVKEKREVVEQSKKQEPQSEPTKDWSKYKRN